MKQAALVIALVVTAVLAARGGSRTDLQIDEAKVRQGASVYAREGCSKCHFLAGKGGNASHPLDGVGTKLDTELIRAALLKPQASSPEHKPAKGMPSFGKLPRKDLNALVAYVSSMKMLDVPR